MRNYGKIYGFISSLVAIGSGIGPTLAGWIYDTTKSYEPFLMGGSVALVFSAVLMLSLPRYPDWDSSRPATPAAA